MKLYLVTGSMQEPLSGQPMQATRWVGTQADAAKIKKAFKDQGLKHIDVKEVDVPTDKQGLLKFLNTGEC